MGVATTRRLNAQNRQNLAYFNDLQTGFEKFVAPSWFCRRTAREIAEYCDILSRARTALWEGVYSQFPYAASGTWKIIRNELVPMDESGE